MSVHVSLYDDWIVRIGRSAPAPHVVYQLCARKPGRLPEDELVTVYVGVTSHLTTRLRTHAKKWWWQAIEPGLCAFDCYETREEANAVEKEMIRWYQPEMNRSGRLLLVCDR